jgi:hypothetical protein
VQTGVGVNSVEFFVSRDMIFAGTGKIMERLLW